MESDGKTQNFLQSQLVSSVESLKIDYTTTNRKQILNDTYLKWQEFKQKIENLHNNLPNIWSSAVSQLESGSGKVMLPFSTYAFGLRIALPF